MREIKFRAWDKDLKKMYIVRELHFFRDGTLEAVVVGYSSYGEKNIRMADKIILMQFTGLKDKSGVEIYEGELIRNETGRICEVIWHERCGQWDAVLRKTVKNDNASGFSPESWHMAVTKIGNIYENPELLEK